MDKSDAKELLATLARDLDLGGVMDGKREENEFNLYIAAGKRGAYRVSLAIRQPRSAGAYAALKRSAGGRNVVEDRVDLSCWSTIRDAFVGCVGMQRLGSAVATTTNVDGDDVEG